jgi:hypothetical protein
MTLDDMKEKAIAITKDNNPDKNNFEINNVYENFMDGALISIAFTKDLTVNKDAPGNKDFNHIYFASDGTVRRYRWHNEVLTAVDNYKERIWFFRFLEFAGMGGLIAVILIIVFSLLLVVLALKYQIQIRIS